MEKDKLPIVALSQRQISRPTHKKHTCCPALDKQIQSWIFYSSSVSLVEEKLEMDLNQSFFFGVASGDASKLFAGMTGDT